MSKTMFVLLAVIALLLPITAFAVPMNVKFRHDLKNNEGYFLKYWTQGASTAEEITILVANVIIESEPSDEDPQYNLRAQISLNPNAYWFELTAYAHKPNGELVESTPSNVTVGFVGVTCADLQPTNTCSIRNADNTRILRTGACRPLSVDEVRIIGSNNADRIWGPTNAQIAQWGNPDHTVIIHGMAGDDLICSGAGITQAFGEEGFNVFGPNPGRGFYQGGPDDETFFPGTGVKSVYAGAGRDTLFGSTQNTILEGQENDDTFIPGSGFTRCIMEDGEWQAGCDEIVIVTY